MRNFLRNRQTRHAELNELADGYAAFTRAARIEADRQRRIDDASGGPRSGSNGPGRRSSSRRSPRHTPRRSPR